jgi:uncharacterized protein
MVRRAGNTILAILTTILSAMLSGEPSRTAAAAGPAEDAATLAELRSRAGGGDAEAEFDLGIAYDLGHLVIQDFATAAGWYRKAAEQGYPPAEFNLGAMYDNGRGVPRNRKLAASWYRRAALHGNGRAQFDLGQMYEHGDGVARDTQQAVRWYRLAAHHGVAAARSKIAALALPPQAAAPPDAAQPVIAPNAAEQARQEYERGLDYWRGREVAPDSAAAFDWFSRAAAHGNAPAAYSLAYLYEYGDGVAQDLIEAYAWYRLAAATLRPGEVHDAALVSAERIAGRLAPQQVNAAEERYRALRFKIPTTTTLK